MHWWIVILNYIYSNIYLCNYIFLSNHPFHSGIIRKVWIIIKKKINTIFYHHKMWGAIVRCLLYFLSTGKVFYFGNVPSPGMISGGMSLTFLAGIWPESPSSKSTKTLGSDQSALGQGAERETRFKYQYKNGGITKQLLYFIIKISQ